MHDGIGGGWTMNVLSNGDGMTMSGLWKISETKGIYIKKNNKYFCCPISTGFDSLKWQECQKSYHCYAVYF